MTDRLTALLHEVDGVDVRVPGLDPVRARGRQIRRRRRTAAAAGGAGLVVAAVLGVGLLSGGEQTSLRQLPAGPAPSAVLPSAAASPVATAAPASPAPEPTAPADAGEDSREPGFLTRVEQQDGTWVVGVDRVQFLTGADAEERAAQTGEPLESDYLVVNDDPRVRTYDVSPDVVVTLTVPLSGAGTTDPVTVEMAELRRALSAVTFGDEIPFDVTVEDGVVVRIDQRYVA